MHWARAGINLFRPVSSILWENSHECIIIIRGAFLSHNKRTNAQIAYRYSEISLRLKIMQLRQNVDYSHLQGTFAIITKKSEMLRSLPLLPQTRERHRSEGCGAFFVGISRRMRAFRALPSGISRRIRAFRALPSGISRRIRAFRALPSGISRRIRAFRALPSGVSRRMRGELRLLHEAFGADEAEGLLDELIGAGAGTADLEIAFVILDGALVILLLLVAVADG